MQAITLSELMYINYYCTRAFEEAEGYKAEMDAIKATIERNNNDPVTLHIPHYWSLTVLSLVDSIKRVAPSTRFIAVKEHMAGLHVKIDGFDHTHFEDIKSLIITARKKADYLVQKRIKDYRHNQELLYGN